MPTKNKKTVKKTKSARPLPSKVRHEGRKPDAKSSLEAPENGSPPKLSVASGSAPLSFLDRADEILVGWKRLK